MKKFISTAIVPIAIFIMASISYAQIPEVPAPTPVEPISTSTVTPNVGVSTTTPVCVSWKTIEVKYACGVEQKCSQVKVMDSYTTFHYETVCVDVEKYCTKTEEVCARYGTP